MTVHEIEGEQCVHEENKLAGWMIQKTALQQVIAWFQSLGDNIHVAEKFLFRKVRSRIEKSYLKKLEAKAVD